MTVVKNEKLGKFYVNQPVIHRLLLHPSLLSNIGTLHGKKGNSEIINEEINIDQRIMQADPR